MFLLYDTFGQQILFRQERVDGCRIFRGLLDPDPTLRKPRLYEAKMSACTYLVDAPDNVVVGQHGHDQVGPLRHLIQKSFLFSNKFYYLSKKKEK